MLLETRGDVSRVKIIDFGTAKRFRPGQKITGTHERIGTPKYMAPEVFKCSSDRGYTEKCDLWSIGVITFALLLGKFPIDEKDERKERKAIEDWNPNSLNERTDDYSKLPESAREFIHGCLQLEAKRWTAEEAMQSAFITQVGNDLMKDIGLC